MTHDVESQVRHLFSEASDEMSTLPSGFEHAVLDGAIRRRRSKKQTVFGGVAACTVVAILAAWQLPRLTDDPTPPTDQRGSTSMTPWEWSKTLPAGSPVDGAFAVDHTLHVGDQQIPITGKDVWKKSMVTVHGGVEGGWLATVNNFGKKAQIDIRPVSGVIAPDGAFTKLPDETPVFPAMAVFSPNRDRFVLGNEIRSASDGRVLQTLPSKSAMGMTWSDAGLIFATFTPDSDDSTYWFWALDDAGSEPVEFEMPEEDTDVRESDGEVGGYTDTGWIFQNKDECTSAGLFEQYPETERTFCAGATVSMSPSAEMAVTDEFVAVDTRTGETTQLDVPEFPKPFQRYLQGLSTPTFYWESDDSFVFGLVGDPPDRMKTFRFVRCIVATQECEQAGDPVKGDGDMLMIARPS